MANNDRKFFDGRGSQEGEVRDLFNQLMGNKDFATSSEKKEATVEAVVEPIVVEPIAVEVSAGESPVEAVEDTTPTQEYGCEKLADEETAPEIINLTDAPLEEDLDELFVPSFVSGSKRAMQFEEDDMPQELPQLILSSFDDEDEDESDQFVALEDLVLSNDDEEEDKEPIPTRRNPFVAFWHALCDNVPLLGDSVGAIVRKVVFWLSIVLVAGTLTYILYNVWWLPAFTENLYDGVAQEYFADPTGVVTQSGEFPEGMSASFRTLYAKNNEIRGWLSYHANGERDFLDIEYPIMYSGDNEKYLSLDFYGNPNKNGALFFDMRAKLNATEDSNTSLIVYGHNMASGQMLAGLNKFIGNVNNARVASMLTMNTLFEQGDYMVFAVVLTDEDAQGDRHYNIRRTQFAGDEDFMQYVRELRDRSLFDYPVDVQPGDQLLLLSTCTAPSSAKIENGRLTVVARKVRKNEIAIMNTAAIVRNEDAIMPYAWYTRQNKQPHATYNSSTTTATTTLASTSVGTSTSDEVAQDETTSSTDMSVTTTTGRSTSGSTASTKNTTSTKSTTSIKSTTSTESTNSTKNVTSTESTASTESATTSESTTNTTSTSSAVFEEEGEEDIIDQITE